MEAKRKEVAPRTLTIWGDHTCKDYHFDKYGDCSQVTVHKWASTTAERVEYETLHGKLHGQYRAWHPNGTQELSCKFENGRANGKLLVWHNNQTEGLSATFQDGVLSKIHFARDDEGNKIADVPDEQVYAILHKMMIQWS